MTTYNQSQNADVPSFENLSAEEMYQRTLHELREAAATLVLWTMHPESVKELKRRLEQHYHPTEPVFHMIKTP